MQTEYRMLREVSRTFALSIEQLPKGPRDALTLGYLLLRVSDGLEDHPALPANRKAALLRTWDRVLAGEEPPAALTGAITQLDQANPEIQVAMRCDELLARTRALPPQVSEALIRYVRQTTLGMARWQEQGPIVATEAEMDDYMHQVAGRVGYLITDVFSFYSPAVRQRRDELLPLGREFGLALQTVNIIRGMHGDHQRGWVFVPRTFYQRHGLTRQELFDPRHTEQALKVVDTLVAKAERHLACGLEYVRLLPRRMHRMRLMCAWPLLFAARTLAISRGNAAVLHSEAKISRAQVRAIMRNTALFGWSNHWLEWYYRRLASTGATSVPAVGR